MKLYSGPLSVFGIKAEIAAAEKRIPVDVELVPFSIGKGYEPKHPEVLRINPKQQVPVLVDGDLELFDSTQIFEYFEHRNPEPALWPLDPRERARARLLELGIDEIFFPNVVLLFPQNRTLAADTEIERATSAIRAFYAEIERRLARGAGPFLLGSMTYADIAFLPAQFMAEAVGVPLTSAFERVAAWRRRMLERPSAGPVHRAIAYVTERGLELPGFTRPGLGA